MSSVFGGGQTQAPAQTVYVPYTPPQSASAAPSPPPNPPMLGAQQKPTKGTQTAQTTGGFSASVLGSTPGAQPTRTLLGTG